MLTMAQSLSFRDISGAPGQLTTSFLFSGVVVLVGEPVITRVDVAEAVGVGMLVGEGVVVEAIVAVAG
jgi:hypothetical protein